MIPAITPPTDNLYKFISLFGLAIFLFAMYNLGIVYDQSTNVKMQIEDLKAEVQLKDYENSKHINKNLEAESSDERFRPSKMTALSRELKEIEGIILNSKISIVSKIRFLTRVSKLNINLDTLWLKQTAILSSVGLGILSMLFGFWRWQKREQTLRDKILKIEHKLKKKERVQKKEIEKENLNTTQPLGPLESIDADDKTDATPMTQDN